ncbi:hypothetical protein KIPB_004774 [Kipferlia bialata]|uniref:Plectin/eS10 N-terminal domain-containing protein n=1 Tax=Kipferlia bialata TaxID=797122 RepID=A0A9K3CPH5_9EUKA|nr:hypothetical protein KIPB_001997 [Kipferlia bialata]GIQ83451.1 hypothetical protein KIPB_004774 [Kipferlia bialata]|eukprot:g1997.t1
MVHVPKATKKAVYQYLFENGCVVVKKTNLPGNHPDIRNSEDAEVERLHVWMTMRSLQSRDLVKENYAWSHHYYFLNEAGIDYLRKELHLPESVMPNIVNKGPARPVRGDDRDGRRPSGDDRRRW